MLIVLSAEHKQDVAVLAALSVDFFAEFCKLAVEFVQKGNERGRKLFAGASKKLGVSAEEVERGVLALAFLLTEAAKFKLAEADLSDSVVSLGLSGEHVATLKSTYGAHVGDLRSMLGRLEFQLPHYVNLDWRLDMEIATRASRNVVNPVYLLNLETKIAGGASTTTTLQTDYTNMKHLASELEQALATMGQVYARRVDRNI